MERRFYTIGEVAGILDETTSLVRHWANTFSRFLHISRNGKGNRLFTPEDVRTLQLVHFLVKEKGMTLEGAAKELSADRASVEAKVKVLDSLKGIREQLLEIRKSL